MKSGLVGRNNLADGTVVEAEPAETVSMKSGLVGRNNPGFNVLGCIGMHVVSMKSGLEDRNNIREFFNNIDEFYEVSMKSGLEDRNNPRRLRSLWVSMLCLNEVRPGRPEQSVRNSLTTNSACTSQ